MFDRIPLPALIVGTAVYTAYEVYKSYRATVEADRKAKRETENIIKMLDTLAETIDPTFKSPDNSKLRAQVINFADYRAARKN